MNAQHRNSSKIQRVQRPLFFCLLRKTRHAQAFFVLLLSGVFLAAMVMAAPPAAAQRFPRLLENIRMFGKGETIEFDFSQPYQGRPSIEHKPGLFALSFSGTGSTKPVRSLQPMEESIYQGIKVVQNRYSTTVTFRFKDPAMSLKDKLDFSGTGRVLKLRIDEWVHTRSPSPAAKRGEDLLQQMEKRIAGQGDVLLPANGMAAAAQEKTDGGGSLAMGDLTGGDFFNSLLSMVIALVVIIGSLYGVLYLYNRFFAGRLRRFTGSHSIRQVASFHIGPRQRIVVLDINGETVACGVTPGQISYLTHLGGKGPVGLRAGQGDTSEETGINPVGDTVPASTKSSGTKSDPVHQFAEVLKQRVRSLKRIN